MFADVVLLVCHSCSVVPPLLSCLISFSRPPVLCALFPLPEWNCRRGNVARVMMSHKLNDDTIIVVMIDGMMNNERMNNERRRGDERKKRRMICD